ncbi:hypothetical protein ACFU98_42855 [Streptomyces sp. NPDC057575]|uniref:hypothetical protein n=1 Tax=unclassified Streptomyces TaxID=2593676 RepID=UPI0036C9EA4D
MTGIQALLLTGAVAYAGFLFTCCRTGRTMAAFLVAAGAGSVLSGAVLYGGSLLGHLDSLMSSAAAVVLP